MGQLDALTLRRISSLGKYLSTFKYGISNESTLQEVDQTITSYQVDATSKRKVHPTYLIIIIFSDGGCHLYLKGTSNGALVEDMRGGCH